MKRNASCHIHCSETYLLIPNDACTISSSKLKILFVLPCDMWQRQNASATFKNLPKLSCG